MITTKQQMWDAVKNLPEYKKQMVLKFAITLSENDISEQTIQSMEKPIKRSFGSLANADFYISPDFDTCFEDEPEAFGLEEYM